MSINQVSVEVIPGEPCEPPMQGLRWVEMTIRMPVQQLLPSDAPRPTTPGMWETVVVKCAIPGVAKGENIPAAAYGYGSMTLRSAAAAIEQLRRDHPVDPARDTEGDPNL